MHQTPIAEAEAKTEELRERLRGEVTAEVRASQRRRGWRRLLFRCGGCCGVYLLALIVIPMIAAALVARTGLVTVPVLSERIAHDRAPMRVVAPARVQDIGAFLDAKVRTAARQSGDASGRLTFTVTESELTGIIRGALAESRDVAVVTRANAQAAVDSDGIELSTRVHGVGGAETTIRVVGAPVVTDGRVTVDVREVTVGALGIPRVIVRPLARRIAVRIADALGREASALPFTVERVDLATRTLAITVRARR